MAKVIPIVRIVDDDETFCMSQKMFLVIGTGMAGLTAAVSAREAGAVRVLLLEKGPLRRAPSPC